jgi:hypothetical protein
MTMSKKTIKTVSEYRDVVGAAVNDVLSKMDADEIRRDIQSRLAEQRFELITVALGLSRRWGGWEVDHCNGLRNAAADVMLSEAETAASDWLKAQAGSLPDLPKAAIRALHKDYLERLEREIDRNLRERAEHEAQRIVNEMLAGEEHDDVSD